MGTESTYVRLLNRHFENRIVSVRRGKFGAKILHHQTKWCNSQLYQVKFWVRRLHTFFLDCPFNLGALHSVGRVKTAATHYCALQFCRFFYRMISLKSYAEISYCAISSTNSSVENVATLSHTWLLESTLSERIKRVEACLGRFFFGRAAGHRLQLTDGWSRQDQVSLDQHNHERCKVSHYSVEQSAKYLCA